MMAKLPWGNPPRGANTRGTHDRGLNTPSGGPNMKSSAGTSRKPHRPVTHHKDAALDKPGTPSGNE